MAISGLPMVVPASISIPAYILSGMEFLSLPFEVLMEDGAMYNVHLDLSLVLGGKPNFDLFFCLTCKTPCKKGKTNVYYYRRFRGGPEMGECPRFFALLALVNAHAKNTPPPGGMGQRGRRRD